MHQQNKSNLHPKGQHFYNLKDSKHYIKPTIVFRTIFAFVRSVAVHSINTFLVLRVIAECAPLMIGGNDNTVLQVLECQLAVWAVQTKDPE